METDRHSKFRKHRNFHCIFNLLPCRSPEDCRHFKCRTLLFSSLACRSLLVATCWSLPADRSKLELLTALFVSAPAPNAQYHGKCTCTVHEPPVRDSSESPKRRLIFYFEIMIQVLSESFRIFWIANQTESFPFKLALAVQGDFEIATLLSG